MTAAEELRRAATLMRERAEKATEGPWAWEPTGDKDNSWALGLVHETGDEEGKLLSGQLEAGEGIVIDGVCESIDGHLPDADYIASWHPGVALAVAEFLDAATVTAERAEAEGAFIHPDSHALKVARAYLGTAVEEAVS